MKAAMRRNIYPACMLVVFLIFIEIGMAVYVHDTMYVREENKAVHRTKQQSDIASKEVTRVSVVVLDKGSIECSIVEKDKTLFITKSWKEQLKTQGIPISEPDECYRNDVDLAH